MGRHDFKNPIQWFVNFHAEHARERKLWMHIASEYDKFWRKYYGVTPGEIFGDPDYHFDKWVDMVQLLDIFHKAARAPLRVSDHDMRQYFDNFTFILTSQLEKGEIEGHKREEFNSVAGFYIRAADIWNAIQLANLPDGGINHKRLSHIEFTGKEGYRRIIRNPDALRNRDPDGQVYQEYLDIKTPLLFALAVAGNRTHEIKDFPVYNKTVHGELVPTYKNPD